MTDPTDDPAAEILKKRHWGIRAHDRLRASSDFIKEVERLRRFTADFVHSMHMILMAGTRVPGLAERALTLRRMDNIIESALATECLVLNGMLHPARREQRYLLEALVKYVATDQKAPTDEFKKRVAVFERDFAKRSIAPIEDIRLFMLDAGGGHRLRHAVQEHFDRLSGFVHASAEQVRSRTESAKEGAYMGFETVEQLRELADESFEVLGLGVAIALHALDVSSVGDLFVHEWDKTPSWSYTSHQQIADISAYFDYKAERQRD